MEYLHCGLCISTMSELRLKQRTIYYICRCQACIINSKMQIWIYQWKCIFSNRSLGKKNCVKVKCVYSFSKCSYQLQAWQHMTTHDWLAQVISNGRTDKNGLKQTHYVDEFELRFQCLCRSYQCFVISFPANIDGKLRDVSKQCPHISHFKPSQYINGPTVICSDW